MKIIVFVFFVQSLVAQINFPLISPPAEFKQKIGLSEIKIEYSRPAARGRKIMGSLVPFGRIWRVGANESTKISFSDSVYISGNVLSPGTYALYAIPEKEEWTVIFHRNLSHWGDGRKNYNPEEDALRWKVFPGETSYYTEELSIGVEHFDFEKGILFIRWENTEIQIPIRFNTHEKVLREIFEKTNTLPTWETFYQSGRYLQEKQTEYEMAREFLKKANELNPEKYFIHRVWSLVEAGLGNYATAIDLAKKSGEFAEKEGKDEFVRMNLLSIEEWTNLLNLEKK
jgi:tetratricopeptide (TPR) repeat protein